MQKSYNGANPNRVLEVHTYVNTVMPIASLRTTRGCYVDLTEDQTKDLVQVLQGVLEAREAKKEVAQLSLGFEGGGGASSQANALGEEGS